MGEVRNQTDALATDLAQFVIKRRWAVVFACLVVTIIAAMGAAQLTFATNYRVFFSDQNPELQAWENFQDTYTRNDNVLVLIKPKTGDVFQPEVLDLIENYTEIAWTAPYILRTDSLSNFQHTYAMDDTWEEDGETFTESTLIVEDLYVNAADANAQDIARVRDIALGEPLLRDVIVSSDAAAAGINIVLQYPDLSINEVPQTIAFARRAMRDAMYAEATHDLACQGSAEATAQQCAILTQLATLAWIPLDVDGAERGSVQKRLATDDDIVAALAEQGLAVTTRDVRDARAFAKDAAPFVIALSGVSPLNNGFSEAGMRDTSTLIPLMFLVVAVVMLISLRTVSGVAATLLIVFLSIPFAMGMLGHIGGLANGQGWALTEYISNELTPITMSAPIVILTLAIADCIHILLTARTSMRNGMEKHDAIVDAVRVNFLAVSITSLTTIIGFTALNFSDSPPYRHFGNASAMGIFAAWALSITLLPALMSLLPMKVKPHRDGQGDAQDMMGAFADFVIANHRKLLVGSAVVSLVLVAMIPRIEFNDQWIDYFGEGLEIREDSQITVDHFGVYPIEFSFTSGETGGINEPEFLNVVEDFANEMREYPGVTHVYSITDIIKRLSKNLNDDDPAFYRIPDSRELAAQYLLLYELSLPLGMDINDRKDVDNASTRVTVTTQNITTAETKALIAHAEAWIAENALPVMQTPEGLRTQATGPQVMFTYVAERNVNSMIRGTAITVVAIAIVMIITLRSWSLGLLSLIPNGLPILTTFGVWAILVGEVGFSVASVAAISLGIVVDDTVHFMTKYRRARVERGDTAEDAIRYAFRTVGLALIVNTVVLAIGFAVLTMSAFKLNGDMGLLTALAITFALILDFLLLLALLLVMPGAKPSSSATKGTADATPNPAE